LPDPTEGREPARPEPAGGSSERTPLTAGPRPLRRRPGFLLIALALIAVGIAVSRGRSSGLPAPGSPEARADAAAVARLLRGIPESGMTLGSPRAPVTVTEFADLECSLCRTFALGPEQELISREVRRGEVRLRYRSLCTATCTGTLGPPGFTLQQTAAYAAGLQHRGWYYIDLFYVEQGRQGTGYATPAYLDGLARQISGLDYARWLSEKSQPRLRAELAADQRAAGARGITSAPAIVVQGPRGSSRPLLGDTAYSTLRAAVSSAR
jgi:protein-disulfide isomerase